MTHQMTVRRARYSDAGEILALFETAYNGNYPWAQLHSREALSKHIQIAEEAFYVAAFESEIVGCVSCRVLRETLEPRTGEHVAEICKLCTSTRIRHRDQVARELCRAVLRDSEARGATGWYATVRSAASLRIAESLGFVAVGYTEEHVVGDRRESHVIMLLRNATSFADRVLPVNLQGCDSVYGSALVQTVTRDLCLAAAAPAEYPSQAFVVAAEAEARCARFHFNVAERRMRAAALLAEPFTYWDALVPCDKADVIARLRANGFRLTAFLPAWHELRFDCVLLSMSLERAIAADPLLERRVRRFKDLTSRSEVRHV